MSLRTIFPPFPFMATLLLAAAMFAVPLQAQNAAEEPDVVLDFDNGQAVEVADEENNPEAADANEKAANLPLNAQISQHILKLAEAERDKRLGFMKVVIDDIVRLCKLDAEQRERLDLAAKGAATRSMKEWHEQAERYFRTRLDNTEGDAAKEMLEGMGNVNFGGNRSEEEGESLDLWKESLKDVLTAEQIAQYEAVLEQRQLDRIEAFAKMSLTTIDSHLRLTPAQKEKMGEVVHQSAGDYLDEVQKYWGDYFERGMLMSLANAAEEDALKAILTEDQYKRLREATSNFDHFWDQKRRLKRAKEKAAERRKATADEKEYEEKEAAGNEGDGDNVIRRELPLPGVRIQGGPGGIRVQGREPANP
jgi:hypothetical protein